MQKEKKNVIIKRQFVCLCRTPCVQNFDFYFNARVAYVVNSFVVKSRQNGMNLSWPCSIPGLLLVCSLSLAGILWCYW